MDNPIRPPRLLAEKKYFFWLGVIFTMIFFGLVYYYRGKVMIWSTTAHMYFVRYGIYVPLVVGLISIFKSYILLFITYVLRINFVITKILIYLVIYGFWLTLAIQLQYFEPRYTDIAIVLIDAYAFPLLVASGVTIGLVLILSLFRTSAPPPPSIKKEEKPIPLFDM